VNEFTYPGTELDLFVAAMNWKRYVNSLIGKYIIGDVLEVGSGIGSNTGLLHHPDHRKWLCLEPDASLFQALKQTIYACGIDNCYSQNGTIEALGQEQLFDSILYLDVLEHIMKDREEMIKASQHLQIGGYLIILAPAYQWLFTPFDEAIGHYRRYSKSTLKEILPNSIGIVKLIYIDCVGLLAILGNKLLLKQSQPKLQQIKIWDGLMVPISRRLDSILGYRFGKSIIMIARKM